MKNVISILICSVILLTSCSKEEAKNETTANSQSVNVKYELIASSKVISPGSTVIISYTNSTGQIQTESFDNSSNLVTWSKTLTITSTVRPLTLNLSIKSSGAANGGYLTINNVGTITQNIYINGIVKSSSVNNSTTTANSWGYSISPNAINYIIL